MWWPRQTSSLATCECATSGLDVISMQSCNRKSSRSIIVSVPSKSRRARGEHYLNFLSLNFIMRDRHGNRSLCVLLYHTHTLTLTLTQTHTHSCIYAAVLYVNLSRYLIDQSLYYALWCIGGFQFLFQDFGPAFHCTDSKSNTYFTLLRLTP